VIGAGLGQPVSPYWTSLLAALGVVGLVAVLAPFALALRRGLAHRDGYVQALAALTVGCYAGLVLVGPAPVPVEAHWELGLLPALTLVVASLASGSRGRLARMSAPMGAGRHRGLPASPWNNVARAALPPGPSPSIGGRHR
jgi:hypothetical protein